MAAKRTTHRSTAGKKLYAVRDKAGKFEDIQTYERARTGYQAQGQGRETIQEEVVHRYNANGPPSHDMRAVNSFGGSQLRQWTLAISSSSPMAWLTAA